MVGAAGVQQDLPLLSSPTGSHSTALQHYAEETDTKETLSSSSGGEASISAHMMMRCSSWTVERGDVAAVSSCFEAVGAATPTLEKTHNQWANSLTAEKKDARQCEFFLDTLGSPYISVGLSDWLDTIMQSSVGLSRRVQSLCQIELVGQA